MLAGISWATHLVGELCCENSRNDLFLLSQESLWNCANSMTVIHVVPSSTLTLGGMLHLSNPNLFPWGGGEISSVHISVVHGTVNIILCPPSLV